MLWHDKCFRLSNRRLQTGTLCHASGARVAPWHSQQITDSTSAENNIADVHVMHVNSIGKCPRRCRGPHQKAAAIMTENMPHMSRSGVDVKTLTLAMLERIVSANQTDLSGELMCTSYRQDCWKQVGLDLPVTPAPRSEAPRNSHTAATSMAWGICIHNRNL